MNMMQYKDYYGSIEYSEADNVMYGKVLFIKDLITFEGETVLDLRKAFEFMIDDYISWCEQEGHEPNKTCKGSLNVRLGPDLHYRANVEAMKNGVSLNKFIAGAVEKFIEERPNG